MNTLTITLLTALAAAPVNLPPVGEEVEVTAGAVTALSCAITARDKGDLGALTGCPLVESQKEIVVYDVAEKQIYRFTAKTVHRYQLESAFGGGSIDFTAIIKRADPKAGVLTVEVSEFTLTPKPKAGAFKGCL